MPYARPDGGESVQELSARILGRTAEILEKHKGQTVAIFTHATPVRTIAWHWSGNDIRSSDIDAEKLTQEIQFCPNASVSVAKYDDEFNVISHEYGHYEHLRELLTNLPAGKV